MAINVKIFRFDPALDAPPRLQDYRLADYVRNATVLDLLYALQMQDPTLRFPRPGRNGMHLGGGININGENRLAHATRMDFALGAGNTLVLRPLAGMQVLRDLVVEVLPADEQLYSLLQHRAEYVYREASRRFYRDRSMGAAERPRAVR